MFSRSTHIAGDDEHELLPAGGRASPPGILEGRREKDGPSGGAGHTESELIPAERELDWTIAHVRDHAKEPGPLQGFPQGRPQPSGDGEFQNPPEGPPLDGELSRDREGLGALEPQHRAAPPVVDNARARPPFAALKLVEVDHRGRVTTKNEPVRSLKRLPRGDCNEGLRRGSQDARR